ncbi:MAG: SusD/RagB family nutrient-binding outer membrane lipoprotein [Bacteroidetes bacterium]|nr:SusD/RagB family nutrient-binding outer membrane lipoprotein [Bacteroidota bacterium]
MKHIILKSFFGVAMLSLVGLSSCTKKINDAYLNPNAPVVVPIETLLPGVIGGFTAFNSANGTNYGVQQDDILLGRYIQYWGSTAAGENYGSMGGTINSDNTGAIWAAVYYGHGQNVNRIIEWGTEQQKWDFVGVAQAIRAWDWLELTNQYGDAILKQAFNTSLQQFLYDTQPEFYDSCRAMCFRALANLDRTDGNVNPTNLAASDFYFLKGDKSKWKKFVYGILARSYNDLSSKALYNTNNYADSVIKYANLSITSNDDNAYATFSGITSSNGVNSYFGTTRSNIGTIRQGAYIADLLSGANPDVFTGVTDPRAWYLLSENNNGTFKGVYPWLGMTQYLSGATPTADYPKNFWRNPAVNATTGIPDSAKYVYSNTSPWPMMTASEMQFTLAEAAYHKGDMATAYAAYVNGISLNFDMLTTTYNFNMPTAHLITPAMKANYMANPAVIPATASALTLSQIMLQKYIALYGWGTHQTWVDMRKYHYSTDLDPVTNKSVYTNFITPPTSPINYLISTNNGKLVYRCRPRYNSEYLYNIPELTRIGALNNDYNTYECWFSQP